GAVLSELLDVEDLAHGHAHHGDRDPVPGLVDAGLRLVGTHLRAPGVGGERGELRTLHPLQGLEGHARRVAAGVAVPAAAGEALLELPGAHNDVVAAFQLDVLLLGGHVEVSAGDTVAVLQALLAQRARYVEEHAAPHHLGLGLLDAALLGAAGGNLAAVVA